MIKVGLCQTEVSGDKKTNIENAYNQICKAAYNGAKIVALGEMFNCPYNGELFKYYAEDEMGETLGMLKKVSRERGIYLIGGSIPEIEDEKIYNTSYIINPLGNVIGKYRKIHLFDIDIKGKIVFKESEFISKGDEILVVDTEYGKVGVCICYDIRFPELFRSMTLMEAKMIFVPAAFNTTTGPAHWGTLFKTRAIDNQIFIFGASPARNKDEGYKTYGHSIVVDPWGEILAEAGEYEEIIYSYIDFDYQNKIREEMPFLKHLRKEIYK